MLGLYRTPYLEYKIYITEDLSILYEAKLMRFLTWIEYKNWFIPRDKAVLE